MSDEPSRQMTDREWELMREDVRWMRDQMVRFGIQLGDLKVVLEHRLTKIEVRSGFVALAVSAVVSVAAIVIMYMTR